MRSRFRRITSSPTSTSDAAGAALTGAADASARRSSRLGDQHHGFVAVAFSHVTRVRDFAILGALGLSGALSARSCCCRRC
jgi:hypothetical protein